MPIDQNLIPPVISHFSEGSLSAFASNQAGGSSFMVDMAHQIPYNSSVLQKIPYESYQTTFHLHRMERFLAFLEFMWQHERHQCILI